MDGTIERLRLLDLEQQVARHLRQGEREHGGIKQGRGNDAVEGQAALQTLSSG